MDRDRLIDLIEASDLDGLIRFIDGLCTARDWEAVLEVRDRCRQSVERGKQLWGVAHFAEYRLALEAEAAYAAGVLREDGAAKTLGPLWEVAASTHPWSQLEPHLEAGRVRALVAHERVVRGEDLHDSGVDPHVLEVPLVLMAWEPRYPVAVYRSDKADFPEDAPVALTDQSGADPGSPAEDPDAEEALYELARVWAEQSEGSCKTVTVAGEASGAIAALKSGSVDIAEVPFSRALTAMAWAGASGGAYGRRRGTPVGRENAWWAVAGLGGLDDLSDPDEVGAVGGRLRWYLWEPGGPAGGWRFHLAVEDRSRGRAWAVAATDGQISSPQPTRSRPARGVT